MESEKEASPPARGSLLFPLPVLLYTLASSSILIVSAFAMSKRSKSRHRHHQSHETKGKEGTAEKNIESPPPLDPTLGKLPKDSDDARDHTDDLFIWKWVKRAGLVAGILYAVVTFLEWKDLRRNFALDQRPWVGVLDTRIIQFGSEQDYILQIQLNNSGKNPALRFPSPAQSGAYTRS